jgi:hypothetical protein
MMDMVRRPLIRALVGILLASAVAGFGAPITCEGRGREDCETAWTLATSNALACAGVISALLAKLEGNDGSP